MVAEGLIHLLPHRDICGHTDPETDSPALIPDRIAAITDPPQGSIRLKQTILSVIRFPHETGYSSLHGRPIFGVNRLQERFWVVVKTLRTATPQLLVSWADVKNLFEAGRGHPENILDCLRDQPESFLALSQGLLDLLLFGNVSHDGREMLELAVRPAVSEDELGDAHPPAVGEQDLCLALPMPFSFRSGEGFKENAIRRFSRVKRGNRILEVVTSLEEPNRILVGSILPAGDAHPESSSPPGRSRRQ